MTAALPTVADRYAEIAAALVYAGGTHTVADIAHAVEVGAMQFWPGPHSAVVTEILHYPQRKALNFFLAGGRLEELQQMYPSLLEWGREQGCSHATFTGRKGWGRTFLTGDGWRPTLQVYERELGDVEERG